MITFEVVRLCEGEYAVMARRKDRSFFQARRSTRESAEVHADHLQRLAASLGE